MKFVKKNILIVTCLVCLLPMLLGLSLWDSLPEQIAIHFDINNNPDNFGSKGFVVFGLPILMMILQIVCCVMNDVNEQKHGERKRFEIVTKWIIPVIAVILQTVTFMYSLGYNPDIRKIAAFIVGGVFLVTGNYLPKLDYVKNYDVDAEKARKINRFLGYETVVMGFLFLISIFLPPYATIVCLFLMIPYAVISIIIGVKLGKG